MSGSADARCRGRRPAAARRRHPICRRRPRRRRRGRPSSRRAREAPRRPAGEPAPWGGLPGGAPGESTWADEAADVRGPTSTVDARLPDAPTRETAAPVWVEPTSRAGDVACSRCGSMNNPDRQFCQHCGQPLAAGVGVRRRSSSRQPRVGAVVAAPRPLGARQERRVRRHVDRDERRALGGAGRPVEPGDDVPGRRHRPRRRRPARLPRSRGRAPSCANARTVLGGKQYEADRQRRHPRRGRSPRRPTSRSSRSRRRSPENVLDRHANTAWATRWLAAVPPAPAAPADPAAAPTTTATPVDLHDDGDRAPPGRARQRRAPTRCCASRSASRPTSVASRSSPGATTPTRPRALFTRPRIVELAVGDRCERYELLDKGSLQALNFAADDVTQVELRIVDVYREDALGRHRRDLRGRLRTRTLTASRGRRDPGRWPDSSTVW